MKTSSIKILVSTLLITSVFACSKSERASAEMVAESSVATDSSSDVVSYAANQEIKDKKFIKTAEVDMEVKNVYDATVHIEKNLKDLGGFVTVSRLSTNIVSEKTYETSDTEAMLVKKFKTENRMQVRVPTQNLGDFLTTINDKKLFLNTRIILAEDVTNNSKIAEIETENLQKTGNVIAKMKNNGEKVEKTENNLEQNKQQKIENLNLSDNLKYSTVDIYITEPKLSVAEIAVTNTKNIDNKYKFNFLYDLKNAFVEGFYLVQKILVGLISIWPILLISGGIFYLVKKKKLQIKGKPETTT